MTPGKNVQSAQASNQRRGPFPCAGALLALMLAAGCTLDRAQVEKNLMSSKQSSARHADLAEHYLVRCPDVIDLQVAHRPEFNGLRSVGLDGRIDLEHYGRPRVEGKPAHVIAKELATELGVPAADIHVRVAEYKSQRLYLFGQVVGWQRAVPYRGQETVLDVLQRTGGITPGAAPDSVYVVRPHVLDGQRPQVFHVDLAAIVVKHDERTNLRVLPDDQIYVGETRQARIEKCIPPWLRPLYQAIWETQPKESSATSIAADKNAVPVADISSTGTRTVSAVK